MLKTNYATCEAKLASSIISQSGDVNGSKAQPRLLVALLAIIKHEMALLNNPSDPSDPRKLQIYREVFEKFISEFRTYEPILSEIKTVYDMTIHSQTMKILELEPFKAKAAILQYEASQEMERFRREASKKADTLEEKNRALHNAKDALESEFRTLQGHLNHLAEELRLKDLANSEQEVLKNQVHYLQAQIEMGEAAYADELSRKDSEITNLQASLQKKSDEWRAVTKDLVSMRFALAQKVPRATLDEQIVQNEALQSKVKAMEEELNQTKAELEKTKYNLNLKVSILKKMESQGKGNFPDWEYVKYNCPGQTQEWVTACRGSDSNEAIVILLRQLLFLKSSKVQSAVVEQVANKESSPDAAIQPVHSDDDKYFVGMGLGGDIPKFLRYKGKVPNRMLSRKDIVLLVNDIWTAKTVYDANPKNLKNLQEFLFLFLKKRFGSQDIVAEWGYNIYKAATKYSGQSADCQIFINVLEGKFNEEVFHQLQETIESLKSMFYKFDMKKNNAANGVLLKSECYSVVTQFWPEKTEQQIQALKHALDADQSGDTLSYSWLFNIDSESSFLDLLKEQELELRERYIQGLKSAITLGSRDAKFSFQDIKQGLVLFDGQKPKEEVDLFLSWGFAMELDQVKPKTVVDLDVFIGNLKQHNIWFGRQKKEI
ncbi:hypothetical protein BDR26DRAFT_922029 [Obelidium mucronatum]|nr:hypothetical protein BDR26DRAFT_922029 [Obelidium mucronatum]